MITHASIVIDAPFNRIPNPMASFEEAEVLQTLCKSRKSVLEIGTYRGITTANIAASLAPDATMDTVDVLEPPSTICDAQGVGECLPENEIGAEIPEDLKSRIKIHLYNPNNPDGLSQLMQSIGRKFDLIFIDGDHSIEGVNRDHGVLKDYLTDDGIMLFHDCWWDVTPMPVRGPMDLLSRMDGVILNGTHLGMLACHKHLISGMIAE